MKRLFEANASSTPPSFPVGLEAGYPKDGESATIPGAWWHYMVTEEIVRAIIAGGLVPAGNDVGQLGAIITTFKNLLDSHTSLIAALQANTLPYGTIIPWAGTVAPTGFIKASGQILARTGTGSYPKLTDAVLDGGKLTVVSDALWTAGRKGVFSLGNGVSTIRCPDLRAEFIRGLDDSAGIDVSRLVGSWQDGRNQDHYHGTGYFTNSTNDDWGAVERWWGDLGTYNLRTVSGDRDRRDQWSTTGGDLATSTTNQIALTGTEARPRNVALLFCIKAYD